MRLTCGPVRPARCWQAALGNKTGSGTAILSGANSYTGATTVTAGTLTLGANSTIPSGSAVTVNGGTAVLDVASFNNTVASVSLQGLGTVSGTTGVLTSTAAFDLQSGSVGAILPPAIDLR